MKSKSQIKRETAQKEKPYYEKGRVFAGGPEYPDTLFVQRCPRCFRENWAPAVASGSCAWCGYKATREDINA